MHKYLVLTTLLLVAGMISFSPAQTWTIEQVTDNTEPDTNAFAVVVSSGIMIGYTHFDGDAEIFYADNFSGSWATSRVTDNTRDDVGVDIAANYNEETAHISFYWIDTPDAEISYCSGSPGSWNTERVTDDADDDVWPSLAIDHSGHIHMTFHKNVGDPEVFYANNVTGSWVAEQVTDNATIDGIPWIALDSDENPNIAYTDASNLLYTKKVSGIWTSPETVASGIVFMTSYPFLTIDADDNCHVTYTKSDGVDLEIYYANNVTGSWQEAKVTSNDYNDAYSTLLVDPQGKIHIAYLALEGADPEIFYANNVAGVWTTSRVTDNSAIDIAKTGNYFVADPSGIGHIFYSNDSDGDYEIYHAYSNSPLFEAVEETEPTSNPVSVSLDREVFSSATTVNYCVPATGHVSVNVYDASGSLVRTLVEGTQSQGDHSVVWDGTQLNSGVYFIHLTVGSQKASAKAIVR